MITAIELPRLRNAEYIQFNKDFLAIVQANDPAALKVQVPYNALQNMLAVLENIFITEQCSAITEDVNAIDARRDKAINGISMLVNAYTYHYNPELVKHADTINRQIAKYGIGIARQTYQAETAIISNLLVDLTTKPDVAAAVTALNLNAWQKEMELANTAFNAAYLQRTQQIGDSVKDKLLAKRLETNTAYYKLRDLIDAYYTINEAAEPYNKTTNRLNALIDQYNVTLAGRAKDDKGGDKGTDNVVDEQPPTPPAE